MNKTKLFAVILLILSFVAFVLTFVLYTTREDEKEKRLLAEQKIVMKEAEIADFQAKVLELNEQIDETEQKLDSVVETKKRIENDLKGEQAEKRRALESLSDEQDKYDSLERKFNDFKRKNLDIINDYKEQNEKLSNMVQQLKTQVANAKRAVKAAPVGSNVSAKKEVELPKVVVSSNSSLQGNVLVVNKKYDFFICSIGREDGIKVNDPVSVFRNNQLVATAKVEKLYDNLCAAGILKENAALSVQEGDTVKVN